MNTEQLQNSVRPGFRGKNVILRPSTPEDVELFATWQEKVDPHFHSVAPVEPRTAASLGAEFRNSPPSKDGATLSVVAHRDGRVLGRVRYLHLNLLARNAHFDAFWGVAEDMELAQEGAALLVAYLYRQLSLNSVTMHCGSFDKNAIATAEKLGFHRDGVLRQRHYFNGECHDEFVYTLLRYEADM